MANYSYPQANPTHYPLSLVQTRPWWDRDRKIAIPTGTWSSQKADAFLNHGEAGLEAITRLQAFVRGLAKDRAWNPEQRIAPATFIPGVVTTDSLRHEWIRQGRYRPSGDFDRAMIEKLNWDQLGLILDNGYNLTATQLENQLRGFTFSDRLRDFDEEWREAAEDIIIAEESPLASPN